ncbi:MAG: imidazolonepropionase [Candidatus Berkiella sp.]
MNLSIWHDACLVTMDPQHDYGVVENGALVIDQDKILWVGKEAALPDEYTQKADFYSAKGGYITPGLIDCHTHLVYAGSRVLDFEQRLKGDQGPGILATVNATREASFAHLYEVSSRRLQAMLKKGVTTVEIKSGYGLDLETERKMLQVARSLSENYPVDIQTTFLGAHVLPDEFSSKTEYIHYLIEKVLPVLLHEGLVDAVDGFCEQSAFSSKELAPLFEFATKKELPIKIHAEQLSNGEGASLALQFKAVSADHLEHLDEKGAQHLKASGSVAVLLPGACYFLQQQQKPPVDLLRKYDIPMALSTDCNPGTSPTTSLLLMLNMGCLLFGLSPLEALQGVTKHAARAMNMGHIKGQLAVGFMADFAVWDIQSPAELCYSFGESVCKTVVKNGKVIYAE